MRRRYDVILSYNTHMDIYSDRNNMKNFSSPLQQFDADTLKKIGFMHSPTAQMVTSNRFIIEYNHSFADLFGYDSNELKGESILRLYPNSSDFEKRGKVWEEILKKHNMYQDDRFMLHRNKTIFWVRVKGITLTPENPFELMIWTLIKVAYNKDSFLTKREQEVASYVVNGLTNKKIAELLNLSPRTIEIHRSNVMKKVGAKNLNDLVNHYNIS